MPPESDSDRTVLEATPRPAPAAIDDDHGNALPVGTRLGEFEITGLIGEGGFGIVYMAHDHSLQRNVALKEYMPSALAARTQGTTVSVKSTRHEETFKAGLRSFVNEARLLAQFDHPSLVKVYRFWEANGTAYMVMPFYEGLTLKQALKDMPEPPREPWLKSLLAQLLEALGTLHREQCFHRDIAPDNILLLKDGRPLLLDFGAARRVIGDMTQALTVILKPGYAPVEQYAEVPHLKQGAWTDIYALAAVVYFAIMGKAPTPSVGRMMNDTLVPISKAAAGRYSEQFLRGIDRALAVKPEERPQNVAELRDLLALGDVQTTVHMAPNRATPSLAAVAPKKSRLPWVGGGVIALGVIGAGAYYALMVRPQAPETTPRQALVQPPSSAPQMPAARLERRAETAPEKAASDTVQGKRESAAPVATAAPPKPFDAIDTLDRIYQRRNRDHSVSVAIDKAKVRIGKDKLHFRLNSSQSGYLYLLMVGTDRNHFYLLFPNAIDKNNRVAADREVSLPRPGWAMVAGGPSGTNHFVALVSDSPREFTDAGLKPLDPFAEFPLEEAARIAQSAQGEGSPFAGKPVCQKGGGACSEAYGAATFTIEEVESAAAAEEPPARPRPEPKQQAKAGRRQQQLATPAGLPGPLPLPGIPGGGRPTPDVEKALREQAAAQRQQSAPVQPNFPSVPSMPRQFIPGGAIPGY